MSQEQQKLSKFVEAKSRVWYRTINRSGTGFMYRKDFDSLADDFIAEYKLDEKTARELRSWMVDGWQSFIDYGKTTEGSDASVFNKDKIPHTFTVAEKITNGDFITEDMYIEALTEVIQLYPELFKLCFSGMVKVFFGVFDTDGDGMISEEDMVRGLHCFGFVKADYVKSVFAGLDKNDSGKVEFPNYIAAWIEFMMGEDQDAPMAKHFTPEMCCSR